MQDNSEDVSQWSIRELKQFILSAERTCVGLTEKHELVSCVTEIKTDQKQCEQQWKVTGVRHKIAKKKKHAENHAQKGPSPPPASAADFEAEP